MQLQFGFLLFILVAGFGLAYSIRPSSKRNHLQEYLESFIDVKKLKQDQMSSLNSTALDSVWSFYKSYHKRTYSSNNEESRHRAIFHSNANHVVKHKLKPSRTFELALNSFSDLSPEEFRKFKKGYKHRNKGHRRMNDNSDAEVKEAIVRVLDELDEYRHKQRSRRNINKRSHARQNTHEEPSFIDWLDTEYKRDMKRGGSAGANNSFDWRDQNVVGSVKDQMQCGSCYAFATTAVMESLNAIQTGNGVTDLSPQQVVDCAGDGCDGGDFTDVVGYLNQQGGQQATWVSYPYVGTQQQCDTKNLNYVKLGNIQYTMSTSGDENALATNLATYGPMYVAIDASSQDFQLYQSGILSIDGCANTMDGLDHAVLAVGYGYNTSLQQAYWIVKNSWGTGWGESGYFLLAKDNNNMCGIATDAYYGQLSS